MASVSVWQTLSVFVSLRSSLDHATDVRLVAVANEACVNRDNQSNLDCLTTDCILQFEYRNEKCVLDE